MRKNDINSTLSIEEMIDDQVKREGVKPKPVRPIEAPILAKGHTAIYKMHRYWARRPHNVFANLIKHYSNPGDLVLDPFCGGGVTVIEALKLRRRVIGIDINPLATWITRVEVEDVDLVALEDAFEKWFEYVKEKVSPLFTAECGKCGKNGQAEWYEWSNVFKCPNCGEHVVLANSEKAKGFQAVYTCTNEKCESKFKPAGLEKLPDKMIAVKVACESCNTTEIRKPLPSDIELAEQIEKDEEKIVKKEKLFIPDDPFPDMDRARDDNIFGKGLLYFKDFFTARQRITIAYCRSWLEDCDISLGNYNALLSIFTSSIRFTNKMVIRSEAWRGTNPLEWPGHMYWLPFTYLESTTLKPLRKRLKVIVKGKQELEKEISKFCILTDSIETFYDKEKKSTCLLLTQSSEKIPFDDESINIIITDPPYGGNVQYLELSDFYLVWLREISPHGGLTDKKNEAIETRHQGFEGAKDRDHYEEKLYKIFKECRRVVKPDGWMVMTFHNRDISVWTALHRAAQRAGFRMPSFKESPNRGLLYQPGIKNYTQTINQRLTGSLLGDFILSFKPTESPLELEAIRQQLSQKEENELRAKSEEIIRYLGGASEDELWTRMIPYLAENGILARVANFNLKQLLSGKPFIYGKKEKKWFMEDMLQEESLRLMDVIPAEQFTQMIIYSYLKEHKEATLDELLVAIYTKLVNAQMPGLRNIDNVLQKNCSKIKSKNNRDYYIWDTLKKSPQQKEQILSRQNSFDFAIPLAADHNGIITVIAKSAISADYEVHAGKTEQRKSPTLANLSAKLTGLELGFSPESFSVIKEIDLLILKKNNIQSAIEVVLTMSTLNKAINDRFRNILTLTPNLNIPLFIVVKDSDLNAALVELNKPANIYSGLVKKVKIIKLSELSDSDLISKFVEVTD